eukprot:TRINITY_DN12320_c0_g1_i1.p1 TRINITY_DN12320_c0_g1~~TRINITY_DN12320_c0_g1_i1.p1  ORF type:complete len:158 (-),score=60.41 TRINITY_DN12320_c0_g1_i1:33-476(-)
MCISERVFFFKQKTAYEISACLVGSEMCIRDRNRFTKLSKESLTNIAKKLGQYIKKSANTMAENVKQSTIQLDTYYFKMKARNPKDMVMWMQKNKDEFVDKDFIDNLENNIEHEKLQFKEKKVKEVAEDVIDFVVEEFIKEFVAMKA